MDIGFYKNHSKEVENSQISRGEYEKLVAQYKLQTNGTEKSQDKFSEKTSSSLEDITESYGKNDLAIRKLDEKLSSMAARLRSECKSNQEVRRYLLKKYFGKEDIAYNEKWVEPKKYAMVENDYNAVCFGTIDCPPNRLDPRLEISEDDWQLIKEEKKSEDKKELNEKMKEVIENNSIPLKESDAFVLRFDPYNYNSSVEGELEAETKTQIAAALNSNGTSKDLFFFALENSDSANPQAVVKMRAYHEIMDITGYDIKNLNQKEGQFFTGSGENIIDVVKESLENNNTFKKTEIAATVDNVQGLLDGISERGFEKTPDLDLSLIYSQQNGLNLSGIDVSV